MEGKKFKVRINGKLCTETFDSFVEATDWVKVFADGVTEVVIESVDVSKSNVGIHEVPNNKDDLLLG